VNSRKKGKKEETYPVSWIQSKRKIRSELQKRINFIETDKSQAKPSPEVKREEKNDSKIYYLGSEKN